MTRGDPLGPDQLRQDMGGAGGGRDWVALILAVGLATAVNIVTIALMWDAIRNEAEISENGTQVLVAAFGGIVGVLGGYVGGRAVEKGVQREAQRQQQARQDMSGLPTSAANGGPTPVEVVGPVDIVDVVDEIPPEEEP